MTSEAKDGVRHDEECCVLTDRKTKKSETGLEWHKFFEALACDVSPETRGRLPRSVQE